MPDFAKLPVYNQLLQAPQRFRDDFEQLPRRMKANLRRILKENAGLGEKKYGACYRSTV